MTAKILRRLKGRPCRFRANDKLADRQYLAKPLREAAEFRPDWRSARFGRDRHAAITGLSVGSLFKDPIKPTDKAMRRPTA
jgi:hypothetical protein